MAITLVDVAGQVKVIGDQETEIRNLRYRCSWLERSLEHAKTHVFDPALGVQGEWIPTNNLVFVDSKAFTELRDVAKELNLITPGQMLIETLIKILPTLRRTSPNASSEETARTFSAQTFSDVLGECRMLRHAYDQELHTKAWLEEDVRRLKRDNELLRKELKARKR